MLRQHTGKQHLKNDPNYFMNEPTFYTSDGIPFTAADPDYQEKYQELLEREDFFQIMKKMEQIYQGVVIRTWMILMMRWTQR